jgi:hypothetical protein
VKIVIFVFCTPADDDDPGDELIKVSEHDEKEWRREI